MSGDKMIPVEESFAEWRKDPDYVKAYNALEDEFSLAAEMIKARASAGLTQEQLAQRMNTSTQAVIARLESGRVKPSTRTLERLAAATGMKLRISFEPGRRGSTACRQLPSHRRFDGLDQSGRRQRRRHRLRRLGRLPGWRALLARDDEVLSEDVAARQRNVALTREAVHELAGDDFFDRARGALDLDAVIALEQRSHFLAGGAQQLRDPVNPNCCQRFNLWK